MEMRRLSHARQREAVEFLDAKGGVGEVTRANATVARVSPLGIPRVSVNGAGQPFCHRISFPPWNQDQLIAVEE